MTAPLFSINSASEILEKDRRTIVKSLRHVKPDGKERGADRWRLKTILDALERMQPPPATNDGSSDPRLEAIFRKLDAAEHEMRSLPTVEKRRYFVIARLRPLTAEMLDANKRWGGETGRDPEFTGLLGDQLCRVMASGWEEPCKWTHSEVWHAMNDGDDGDDI